MMKTITSHHHARSNHDPSKIEEMEDTFHLVMVAERWDESMVLLKDLLCWEFRSGSSVENGYNAYDG